MGSPIFSNASGRGGFELWGPGLPREGGLAAAGAGCGFVEGGVRGGLGGMALPLWVMGLELVWWG